MRRKGSVEDVVVLPAYRGQGICQVLGFEKRDTNVYRMVIE